MFYFKFADWNFGRLMQQREKVCPAGSLRVLSSPITVTEAPATSTALLSDSVVFALAGAGIVILAGLLLLGTQLRRSRR